MIKLLISIHKIINRINFIITRNELHLATSVKFKGSVIFSGRGSITIGEKSIINSGVRFNPIGFATSTNFVCSDKGGEIIIGKNVGISNSSIVAHVKVSIEDNVMIGNGCRIWDTDFHALDFKLRGTKKDIPVNKPILIKKNSFIGGGVIVLKGVIIGENSIIAAGSVVTKSIPNNEIWGGNPAKFIRSV